ncbi:hypothetical protein JCM5353_005053 [Sporobolomyces roseus]
MASITTFVLDLSPRDQTLSLIILYILPQLSNLRRLVLPDKVFLPRIGSSMAYKFDKVARKITEWDVKLSKGLAYEPLVFTYPSAIRSLTVATDSDEYFRLLGSETTSFSAQLVRCSSLETLTLHFNNLVTTPVYDICHPHSLSLPYAFRQTLITLDLSFTFENEPAHGFDDVSIIRFASTFSNLRHLRLKGLNFSSTEARELLDFPHLVQLELLGLDDVEDVVLFLAGKTIPKLEQLELGMSQYFDLANDGQYNSLSNIAEILNRSLPTLTLFRLHHYEGAFEYDIHDFMDAVNCTVETSWRAGRSEDLNPVELGDRDTAEIARYGLEAAVEDIVEWTEGTYKELVRQRDVTGLRNLWKEMGGLQDYRKWMED